MTLLPFLSRREAHPTTHPEEDRQSIRHPIPEE
jgi:hypothetical protein